MRRLIQEMYRRYQDTTRRRQPAAPVSARPALETLEDRTALSVTVADGVVSGQVIFDFGGGAGGAPVTLTGTTTTHRSINVTAMTNSQGQFSFTQVLPGTYNLTRGTMTGFMGGSQSIATGILVTGGQVSGFQFDVAGVSIERVSLADFFADGSPLTLPSGGAGTAFGFSLNSATPLPASSVTLANGPSFVNLAASFVDPDTTPTIVQFQTPQGNIGVQLDDSDTPEAVTNFLDYLDPANDLFAKTLFTRESSLNMVSGSTTNFALTPIQVLQGGGANITSGSTTTPIAFASMPAYKSINLQVNPHLTNTAGTLAMASAGSTITNQFFFNLTNNTQALGSGFTVFGQVTGFTPTGGSLIPGTAGLSSYAANFTARDETTDTSSNQATIPSVGFSALPLLPGNGYTPTTNSLSGASASNLAQINNIVVTTASNGKLTYSNPISSNTAVVTVKLGSNTSGSTFSTNQLQLTPVSAGMANITVTVTDKAGEQVTKTFTVTVS